MAKFRAPLETTVINYQLSLAQLQTLATDLVSVHQANTSNFVIRCNDQLEAGTIEINETWETNLTQCSSAPASKTKTGLEAMATLSIGDDRIELFQLATNGKGTNTAPVVAVSSITTASTTVTSATLFGSVLVGYRVSGTGIPANTIVTSKASASSITISNAATVTNASASLTFTPSSPALVKIGDDSGLTTGTSDYSFKTVVLRPYSGGVPTQDISRWFTFPAAGIEGTLSQSFSLQNQYSYQLKLTAYDPFEYNYKILRGNTALLT
jgi:hypothetical protein